MSSEQRAMYGSSSQSGSTVSPWAIGFAVFAGILMMVNGMFQIFQGLAVLLNDGFFSVASTYAYELDSTAWGLVHMAAGVLIVLTGMAILSGQLWARLVGITLAAISMMINFFYIPYYPVWALLIIALDIVVIWALASYNFEARDEV